ncbi:MAG TPA: HAMP domain-containing sensor histidine kinase [Cellvibrio sp.]|nr:HAMP domain-containing sensor histidine kinase [Cellvibrio sp.]
MKISKSLRFRIIAGYVAFTLITTLCYTLSGLLVLKISDDELFNWYIARVAEGKFHEYVQGSQQERNSLLASKNIIVGMDADVIGHLQQGSVKQLPKNSQTFTLENWPDVSHISRADKNRFEIFEVRFAKSSFHIVKIPLPAGAKDQHFFYYVVDISAYNISEVWAAQGTYFGLFILLLVFMLVASLLGFAISRKVIAPLTQLTHDVAKASVGSKLNSYYPDEVGVLAIKINDLMTRIGGFIDREKAFSRDVSHELRTPVTSSQIALELAMHLTEKGDPKLREVLGRIGDANRDMIHLIDTFMLIGRENIPSTAAAETNLFALIKASIERNSYLIEGKDVVVINMIDEHIAVNLPHDLLLVVVDNILRNAFQYTDKGNVTLQATKEFISVTDTGRGFDQSALDRLLLPYETYHGEGIGLGLNIIKRICELTGWRLEIRSECGLGSFLTVHF